MKVLVLLFCCVLIAQANVLKSRTTKQWEQFKMSHKKSYGTDTEHEFRFKIFAENLRKIAEHNKKFEEGKTTYKMGINKYADMLTSEFADMMLTRQQSKNHGLKTVAALPKSEVPDTFDWRPQGAVTPVKDQGQCGSCWAFSATGTTEGAHFLATGELVSLSEQNLMDCSFSYGNMACSGGWENKALEYIVDNGGIDTEESYPYEEKTQFSCSFDASNVGATATGVKYTVPNDENDLKTAVATIGPISIAVDATPFHMYESGILVTDDCSSSYLNHAILAVGYGSENGQDYWLVKNSWGTSWGEDGYIRMARNHNNMCGVATEPCYPTV